MNLNATILGQAIASFLLPLAFALRRVELSQAVPHQAEGVRATRRALAAIARA